ncbi:hypothetical protein EG327_009820 [Venturia inaequalis]|uniref:DNA-directed DNA polymerase n=1 Tax=Venturia inaequalis TaxID=5025 RepID=A0A8H3UIW5_VENIN|nr:hypothetical protein EG327_009820 [Venturia inaequalis]
MTSSPAPSSPTLRGSSPPVEELDFSHFPPIFVLSAHLSTDDLHDTEDQLQDHGAVVTYDINEAKLVIGKVGTKKRAQFELRSRGLWTEEAVSIAVQDLESGEAEPRKKKARPSTPKQEAKPIRTPGSDSSTESETEFREPGTREVISGAKPASAVSNDTRGTTPVLHESNARPDDGQAISVNTASNKRNRTSTAPEMVEQTDNVRVLKLQWLEDSFAQRKVLDTQRYMIYEGTAVKSPPGSGASDRRQVPFPLAPSRTSPKSQHNLADKPYFPTILERARGDTGGASQVTHSVPVAQGARRFGNRGTSSQSMQKVTHQPPARLLEMTTSEYDGSDSDIPKAPDWVQKNLMYSCQRSTPANPPNESFIEALKKIRLARLLIGDEIGVRAYSTFIAAVAAYPYAINNPREILRLPGCNVKLANLWIEWKNFGVVKEAEDTENDEALKGLKLFYDIWGVGATTARAFYKDKGWRDTDDVIEYGWKDLNRVQQIGLKYYEEFKLGIPRAEVESIAAKVREHAVKVRDEGIELMVVGGYRRGKAESGDVDIIVSHRDLQKTAGLVSDIVASLETDGWITHTLTLSLTSTKRGQSTLPLKGVGVASHGVGFDTLDKALVVWQDPTWQNMESDLAEDPQAKNPNVHRRVDIIISPWRTVGCAITGWSGGTTFERDLRRFARATKGWKFDSSGVRDRMYRLVSIHIGTFTSFSLRVFLVGHDTVEMVRNSKFPKLPTEYGRSRYKRALPTLNTVPAELFDGIISRLNDEDLFQLRRVSKPISKKCFHVFAKRFLEQMVWNVAELVHTGHYYAKSDAIDKTIAGLELLPDLVQGVKHLALEFGAGKPLPQNEGEIELPGAKTAADVNILYNLRSLSFDGVFKFWKTDTGTGALKNEEVFHQNGHEAFFDKLHLAQLEHFAIKNSDNMQLDHLLAMLVRHRKTLKTVELIRVTLTPSVKSKQQNQAVWIRLLDTARRLRPDTTMTFTAPRVFKNISKKDKRALNQNGGWYGNKVEVYFKSVEDEKDGGSIHILAGEYQGHVGLHYFSQPGHLHKSLEYLIRNYKELLTLKEVTDAGATYKKHLDGEKQPKQHIAGKVGEKASRVRDTTDDATSRYGTPSESGTSRTLTDTVFDSTTTPTWAPDGSLLSASSSIEYHVIQHPLPQRPYLSLRQTAKNTFGIESPEQEKRRSKKRVPRRRIGNHGNEYGFNRSEMRIIELEEDALHFISKKSSKKG